MASPKAAVEKRVDKIDAIFLIDLMILSLPPNSQKARTSPSRRVVVDSMEWQLWSCAARGCSANMMPVFLS